MAETRDSNSFSVPESNYPGERLGLPESGPGSVASFGLRILGLIVDWSIASLLSWWLFDYDALAIAAIFVVLTSIFIWLLGGSLGHIIFGMRVNTVQGEAPGWWRPWVRQLLLVFVLPALIMDRDQRGAHESLSGLVLRKFR
ncbi:MAG: RDD family protein [Gulosibacter sp.]|uniref:RDD family protein n=1 Tax=Gulosibacter sp. TaxID=2817531 RepID=UPI003F8F5099